MKNFTKGLIDISFKTTNKTFNFIILFCFISAVSKDDNIIARGRREAVCIVLIFQFLTLSTVVTHLHVTNYITIMEIVNIIPFQYGYKNTIVLQTLLGM